MFWNIFLLPKYECRLTSPNLTSFILLLQQYYQALMDTQDQKVVSKWTHVVNCSRHICVTHLCCNGSTFLADQLLLLKFHYQD